MRHKHLLFLLLILFMKVVFAQQAKIDSMLNVIEQTNNDSIRYHLVNSVGFTYIFQSPDKFMPFAEKHLVKAKKAGFRSGIANLYNNIGIYYDVQGQRDSSEVYFNKALRYSEQYALHNVHSKSLNNLGMFHWNKGEFKKALPYFFDALELLNKTESNEKRRKQFESKYRNNIGLIYQEMKLYEKAIKSHHIALSTREKYDMRSELPPSYTNLGICYRHLGKRDSAFYYLNKSLRVSTEEGLLKEQKIAHDNLGNVYQDAGEINQAIFHYNKSIQLGKELPNTSNSDIITLGNLVHLYNTREEWNKSLKAIDLAENILEQDADAKRFAKDIFRNGAITFFKTGNASKGEAYLEQFVTLQDSTFTKENADLFAEYEARFDSQEKERQLLQERNRTQQLELENLASEQTLVRQKNTIYLLIIGILFIGSAGYFFYWRKRQKLKEEKNQALLKAKTENIRNVISAQEKERERLARELHDGLVQEIRMLKTELNDTESIDEETKNKLAHRISNLKNDARNLAYEIMPTALRKSGLVQATRDLVNNSFSSGSIQAEFFAGQDHIEVAEQVKTNVYRILQEAINNIIKHSEAKEVHVSMNQLNNTLIVTVEDDGKGFDRVSSRPSIGLKSMESRAALINGSLDIESSEKGTTLTVRIKL